MASSSTQSCISPIAGCASRRRRWNRRIRQAETTSVVTVPASQIEHDVKSIGQPVGTATSADRCKPDRRSDRSRELESGSIDRRSDFRRERRDLATTAATAIRLAARRIRPGNRHLVKRRRDQLHEHEQPEAMQHGRASRERTRPRQATTRARNVADTALLRPARNSVSTADPFRLAGSIASCNRRLDQPAHFRLRSSLSIKARSSRRSLSESPLPFDQVSQQRRQRAAAQRVGDRPQPPADQFVAIDRRPEDMHRPTAVARRQTPSPRADRAASAPSRKPTSPSAGRPARPVAGSSPAPSSHSDCKSASSASVTSFLRWFMPILAPRQRV